MAKSVIQASFSKIASDPRIQRAAAALADVGYTVKLVGYDMGVTYRPMTAREKLNRALRQVPSWVVSRHFALTLYWQAPEVRQLCKALLESKADIIHVHDVEALPAAAFVARKTDAKLIYDSHEHATSMRSERLLWRLVYARFLEAIERVAIRDADAVVTVGQTLAHRLQSAYRLKQFPAVIRNVPEYERSEFQATKSGSILLHYHGGLNSGRGLKTQLKILQQLPKIYRLRLTGAELQPGYVKTLKAYAQRIRVADRVEFHSAVAPDQVIKHANEADIGLFLVDCKTVQQECALPNKIFEYVMAGMMVCAGTAPDVKAVIRKEDLGLSFDTTEPHSAAEQILALTPDVIDTFKRANLKSAETLNWGNEKEKLLSLYDELYRPN